MKEKKQVIEKVSISLNEIEIKDLDGKVFNLEDLPKKIGNLIFINSNSIEISDAARILHRGESIDLNERELHEILEILTSLVPIYKPWAQHQISEYIQQKLNIFNK